MCTAATREEISDVGPTDVFSVSVAYVPRAIFNAAAGRISPVAVMIFGPSVLGVPGSVRVAPHLTVSAAII